MMQEASSASSRRSLSTDPRKSLDSRSRKSHGTLASKCNNDTTFSRRKQYAEGLAQAMAESNGKQGKGDYGIVIINDVGENLPIKEVKHLKKFFDELDADGNGSINLDEMSSYFARHYDSQAKQPNGQTQYKSVGASLVSQIEAKLQDSGSGSIVFTDVLKMVHPNADKAGLTRMNDLVYPKTVEARRVSVKINEDDRVDLHDLWDRFDKSLCGELDESQLRDMLQSMGMDTEYETQDWDDFLHTVKFQENGKVSKEDFTLWWFSDLKYMRDAL